MYAEKSASALVYVLFELEERDVKESHMRENSKNKILTSLDTALM